MSPIAHGVSGPVLYLLTMVYVSILAVVGAGIWYTNYSADQNNRRWCGILRVYHEAYATNPPPPTQLGLDIQKELERLYAEFHCDSVGDP